MATSLGFFSQDVWWELALLIVIMLLGHWVEMRAIGQAQGALATADVTPQARVCPSKAGFCSGTLGWRVSSGVQSAAGFAEGHPLPTGW